MSSDPNPETIRGVPLGEAILALRLTLLVALAVALPVIALACGNWGAARARAELMAETRGTLDVFRANLVSELEKHEAVPYLLAQAADTATLLAHPTPETVDRLNRRLDATAAAMHAAALYVIDSTGATLAASNWDTATSFVGKNFSFRPYFREALEGGVGRYFALGTSSHQPGYYIAYPVRAENRTLGTVVIKLGMERVERGWSAGSDRVIVTDGDGVIIITNTPSWRYRSLKPLSASVLTRIEASQKFPEIRITPLPVTGQPLDAIPAFNAGETIGIGAGDNGGPAAARYVMVSSPVPGTDWTLSLLLETTAIQSRAMAAAVIGGFGTVIVILAGFQLLQRWMRFQERLADQRRARADLERRVEARTADLARANEELRAAQNELVQAAKLAALGQMSASVAHEINQP
ncbi:MAG: cache domain-containing protein, partial [Rhodospirillaceae bacterium]